MQVMWDGADDLTPDATLQLLDGPHVVMAGSRRVAVPEGSKRLVAYVALRRRSVDRRNAAADIWPQVDQHRAAGNLRSAMWRLRSAGIDIIDAGKRDLALDPRVRVDLDGVAAWADRVVAARPRPGDLVLLPLALRALDLLPGWYDDWVLDERQRMRDVLLDAFDALAALLVAARRCGDAVDAALAAVAVDPLRETAQRTLIEAHLAEGNRCEALRSYLTYEDLLARELGVGPSVELTRMLRFSEPRAVAPQRSATIAKPRRVRDERLRSSC